MHVWRRLFLYVILKKCIEYTKGLVIHVVLTVGVPALNKQHSTFLFLGLHPQKEEVMPWQRAVMFHF